MSNFNATIHIDNTGTAISKDGTIISYQITGNGPGLILIPGVLSLAGDYNKLANIYLAEGQKDSSLYFSIKLLKALKGLGSTTSQRISLGMAYESVYGSYKLR